MMGGRTSVDSPEPVTFSPFKRRQQYEHVLEEIRDRIRNGQLEPGAELPTEHELSQLFHVSRGAVRQAMTVLRIMGLVEIRPGNRTRVSESRGRLISTSLELSLSVEKDSRQNSIDTLIEAAETLERRAAELAAERASDESVAALEKNLEAMQKAIDSPSEFLDADTQFHQGIAAASQNQSIEAMLGAIRSLLHEITPTVIAPKKELLNRLEYHKMILAAIRSRNPLDASRAISKHIENIEKSWYSSWSVTSDHVEKNQ
jgi:GntR family transcriptional regulator, transcriptional repressor for pyruvate dehydrogenase complex